MKADDIKGILKVSGWLTSSSGSGEEYIQLKKMTIYINYWRR